jgi:squalene cyclase
MTKRERELIAKIYAHLNTMGSLTPANPADVRAVSINLRTSTKMARALQMALHYTVAGEYQDAEEYIAEAQAALEKGDRQIERETARVIP